MLQRPPSSIAIRSSLRRQVLSLAVSVALAGSAWGEPATQPVDWNARIHDALTQTGDLTAVAADLAKAQAAPDVQRARIRVALEQGDLVNALALLKQSAADAPKDVATLEQLSRVQEMASQTGAAVQTLMSAVAATDDVATRSRLQFRLAALAYDDGRPDDGDALLKQAVASDAANASHAGIIAFVYGRFAASTAFYASMQSPDAATQLLAGDAALKSGNTDAAKQNFDGAFNTAKKTADRSYAMERQIATARQSKTLPKLADAWLADAQLPADRTLPLATVLRELGRVPELIAWWRAHSTQPQYADVMLSERFVNEVLGAAQSTGHGDEALAVCNEMLQREPASWDWLTATLRAEMNLGRLDAADATLRSKLKTVKDDPAAVQHLGRLARTFGRDQVAIDAGDVLGSFGGGNAVVGRLLAASVYDRAGNRVQRDKALQDATDLALKHPVAVNDVVAALEGAEHDDDAIKLLQTTLKAGPDEQLQSRLVSLLLKLKRNEEAKPVIQQMMERASSPAVRAQTAQRLLEAYTATNSVGTLITQLQDRLKSKNGTEQDLSLLVDAQLSQNKFNDAIQTIQTTPLLDDVQRLRRLSVLFLRNGKLDQAEASLRDLAKADPKSQDETLERLASVAIARKKPDDAAAAIHSLEEKNGPGQASIELMAGVYNRLGRTADAAQAYRRLLAMSPNDADDWLLWSTAMSKTGRGTLARRRLQVLSNEAPNDNVFAVAVDGLLNLDAPPETLRVVRRDAILRLSERPAKMMLYHVLADVSEELSDPAATVRATEASIAFSEEERSQSLRQLMETASQNGLIDTAIDCGRSLLALGDDFPPQLFLQLGEQLLIDNRVDEAGRAFARASESSDPDLVAGRVAALLKRYDFPVAAVNALRPLADRRQADADFRGDLAELSEKIGQDSAALPDYLAVIGLVARNQAGSKPQEVLDVAVAGAMITARTPQQEETVLSGIEAIINDAIAAAGDAKAPPAGLEPLSAALRHTACFFNQPARADQTDNAILSRWPAADNFAKAATMDRLYAGRVAAAYAFAQAHHVALPEQLQNYADGIATVPATLPATVTASWAARVLPPMMVRGQYDQAREILSKVTVDADLTKPQNFAPGLMSPFRTLIMAADAMGDEKLATHFANIWTNSFEQPEKGTTGDNADDGSEPRRRFSTLPSSYMALVSSSWHLLPADAKAAVVDQLKQRTAAADNAQLRGTLSNYVLKLAGGINQPVDRPMDYAVAAIKGQPMSSAEVALKLIPSIPAEQRGDFLKSVIESVPPTKRLSTLLSMLGRVSGMLDEKAIHSTVELAGTLPPGQVIDWSDWFYTVRDPAALRALADDVQRLCVEAAPSEAIYAAVRAAGAAALANAGESEKADQTASDALAALAQYIQPKIDMATHRMVPRIVGQQPERGDMLRVAVAALSAKGKAAALAKLDAAGPAWTQADSSWRMAVKSVLLETSGDRDGAMAALHAGLSRDPNDLLLTQLYRDRLVDDGRVAELAGMVTRLQSNDRATLILRGEIAATLQSLYRWREVPLREGQEATSIDLATPLATGDKQQLAMTMRSILQRLRQSALPDILTPPSTGGADATPFRLRNPVPPAELDAFAEWPGTLDDVMRTLHCGSTNGPSVDWMATLLTRVAVKNETVRTRLLAQLEQSRAADTLSPAERGTIGALAKTPEIDLPRPLLDPLWPMAVAMPAGPDINRVASALELRDHSAAAAKWGSLNVTGGMRDSAVSTPFDSFNDVTVAQQLQKLAATDENAALSRFAAMDSAGGVLPTALKTRAFGLRVLATQGDIAGFAKGLDGVLRDFAWQQIAATSRGEFMGDFDIALALPDHLGSSNARIAVATAVKTSIQRAADQWPGMTDFTHMLSTTGNWLIRAGDTPAAQPLLEAAAAIANRQGIGQQQLFVADLAVSMGDTARATEIEKQLLEHRMLPSARIVPLLERLSHGDNASAVPQLAADASQYSSDPRLSKMAAQTQVSNAQ